MAAIPVLAAPIELHRIRELAKGFLKPRDAADQGILLQRNDCGCYRIYWCQGTSDIALADVLGQGEANALGNADFDQMKKPPWPKLTMLISIGKANNVLVRDAINATLRALAISSAVASTIPRIFF